MSVVRRVLIGIVGLLLLLDCTALGLVKFASGPAPSKEKSKVVLWIDDKADAEKAVDILKKEGYEPLLKPAKRATFVEANYRVVMTASRRELLQPVANVLKRGGHKNLSFNEDGTALYYGGVFAEKAAATRVAKSLKAKEMLVFEVQPGQKKVMKDSFRVILIEVPTNLVSSVTDPVSEAVEVADTVEEPLTPAEPEADAEESAEE